MEINPPPLRKLFSLKSQLADIVGSDILSFFANYKSCN